jgi:hypothetical protein
LWQKEDEFRRAGAADLRHGVSAVAVSTLASQYYCEYKIENGFMHGEIPTESKEAGTALHEEMIPLEPASREEFVRSVKSKDPAYAVLPLWGSLGSIRTKDDIGRSIRSLG